MSSTTELIVRVDALLARTLEENQHRWAPLQNDLETIFEEIRALVLGGGKRLRPQFSHWGWVAAGGDPASAESVEIGAAIELLHAAALFHDDVIDDADTRRSRKSTHKNFSESHSTNGWVGEARRFGEGSAILIGDITYVLSDSLTNSLSAQARLIWHDLRLEMNIGQYLDVLGSARQTREIAEADLICRMKSAKYTIERPLHLGAVAADPVRGSALMPMLSAYGLPLGDAFQMRDDILGAFGDTAITGKPVGGDFREGKPTPLLARACAVATGQQADILNMVGAPDLSDEDIAKIQQVVTETGALQAMEDVISTNHAQAVQALKKSEMQGESFDALVHLADVVTQRVI
jgi:geranylgeranyl diphosphate synthase, type I